MYRLLCTVRLGIYLQFAAWSLEQHHAFVQPVLIWSITYGENECYVLFFVRSSPT